MRSAAAGNRVACAGEVTGTPRGELMQIGQVAERTGLSLRTIRFYEENGLVLPTARSEGGFRLYSQDDVARLDVIKRMKPLGFSLEEMQELLGLLTELDSDDGDRAQLLDRLRMFHEAATARVTALRDQLAVAEGFAGSLAAHLDSRR
ncbi:MerR family transcriptional regulator [Blastococcus capsensis]|uniref:MerR family transcriptional regulator n=1 Tax=Blastococcus capsensis TaxID=1564163 RepID=UPI0025405D89|nr:MerR family transcriptional regulator [Blastococcus capsensis]MDK3258184.1 MerR family transcriptional regulator [Blastococcus capsensis]